MRDVGTGCRGTGELKGSEFEGESKFGGRCDGDGHSVELDGLMVLPRIGVEGGNRRETACGRLSLGVCTANAFLRLSRVDTVEWQERSSEQAGAVVQSHAEVGPSDGAPDERMLRLGFLHDGNVLDCVHAADHRLAALERTAPVGNLLRPGGAMLPEWCRYRGETAYGGGSKLVFTGAKQLRATEGV